jgi:hypothetical protein
MPPKRERSVDNFYLMYIQVFEQLLEAFESNWLPATP